MFRPLFLLCILTSGIAIAQSTGPLPDPAAIRADIALQERAVSEAAADVALFGEGSAIWSLASLRKQLASINLEALKARLALLESDGEVIAVTIPIATPNPELTGELLGQIADQEARVEEAEIEAASVGGLLGALAASRTMAEKTSLAMLRAAYFRAAYGVAWPDMPVAASAGEAENDNVAPDQSMAAMAPVDAAVTADPVVVERSIPPWADPDHPEIDYNASQFMIASAVDASTKGWWLLVNSRSPVDDSPQINAINLSGHRPRLGEPNRLFVRCAERELSVVFLTDEFLMSDYRQDGHDVLVRVDAEPARTERWGALNSNKGAGVFGARGALPLMQAFASAEKVFVRIMPSRGSSVDETFDLAGASEVMERVAATCGETLISLAVEDYRNLQALLIEGGYLRGQADGVWGPASRAAMIAFQKEQGLPETGAPDRATMAAMGLR